MLKVIHLVPYDGIGGVETAARSMKGHSIEDIDFQVEYIYPPANIQTARIHFFNPWYTFQATRRILISKPDLLIVSLWRSCIVALLSKLLGRRPRLVLFLHFPSDVHWLDRLLTRCVAALADEVWADSQETLDNRLPSIPGNKRRVISFVTRRIASLPARAVKPVFVFWGRLHSQKGLERALRIFSAVHESKKSARFTIIGPDGGELERISTLVNTLDFSDAVRITGKLDFNMISRQAASASFYLQTSLLEGMAMSVVESMQLGLVPIVTAVGEIKKYCKHGENALVVESDEAIVDEVLAVLGDEARYQTMRANALATWADKPIYAESVLQACEEVLLKKSDSGHVD